MDRGARGAETDSHIARLIHRGAGHPAPGRVGLVGALLKDHRCGRDGAQLKPAHTGHASRTHGIIAHNRFVAVGELAIREPEHQTIANAVQTRLRRQLGHTGSVGAGTERGKASRSRTANKSKGSVGGRDEIGVEKSDLVGAASRKRDIGIADAGRRENCPVEVAGQERRLARPTRDPWRNKSSGHAGEHFRAIKRKGLRTEKGGASRVENVHGHVVAVGPDAEMGIVKKVGTHVKAVAIVGAGGVGGRRDGDALIGDRGAARSARKLGDDPAVRDVIIEHDRVAKAAVLAGAAEAGPDGGDPQRSQDRGPGCLIKDLITFVHHLDVLSQSYGAVCIGRVAVASDTGEDDAVKIEDGGGHGIRDQKSQHAVFNDRVRSVLVQGERQFGIQIGFAQFLCFVLQFCGRPERRKVAQRW